MIDTDIGSDVDDLVALAVIAGLAPRRLRAITTVYGPTLLRAQLAACACRMLRAPGVAVAAGASRPSSGRDVWLTGDEGVGWPPYDDERVEDASGDPGLLARVVRAQEQPPQLIAIGPLTNLARALRADPGLAERIDRVFVMGGFFGGRRVEHNFASDPQAAADVFASELRVTVCGLEVTLRAWLGESEITQLESAGDPAARLIAAQARRWWTRTSESFLGDSPHDAVCALAALRPGLFTTERCTISVDPESGAAVERADPAGRHELVTDLRVGDVDACVLGALLVPRRSGRGG